MTEEPLQCQTAQKIWCFYLVKTKLQLALQEEEEEEEEERQLL
jgi:hypothetical protein